MSTAAQPRCALYGLTRATVPFTLLLFEAIVVEDVKLLFLFVPYPMRLTFLPFQCFHRACASVYVCMCVRVYV